MEEREGVGERFHGSDGIFVKGWGIKFVYLPTGCWKVVLAECRTLWGEREQGSNT